MESQFITIKTEVEEEEVSTNWVNTNQSCFLCLQYSTEVKVIHLRSLLGHLQINEQEVYPDGNPWPDTNGEWDDILVDLCKSCGASHFRLYTLLQQLQEIQMEIDNILEETDKSISESGRNRKLEESFFAKLGSNPRTPFNSEFVDNLRKKIAEKCKIMLSGQQIDNALESGIHEAVFDNGNESSGDEDYSSPQMEMLNTTAISVAEEEPSADFGLHSAASSESFAGSESESLGDADSSSNQIEMLNTTGISVAQGNEEEPAAHSSSHSASSSEPRRSLRRRKQEALLEKKSPSAIFSGEKSKNAVPSTSKYIETQTSESNSLKESSMCKRKLSSQYHTKNSNTGLFQCRKCDKKSPWHDTIRIHYKATHLKITHPCDICKVAVFTRQRDLARHQLTCQQSLKKLQAVEKDPKFRFVCEICGKRFDNQKVLHNHRRVVHKNVDRYPCDLCDKKFQTNYNLNVHKNAVHFRKKISCRFCKKLFGSASQSKLMKHENSCMHAKNR